MQNDKYYNDVQIDQNSLASLRTAHAIFFSCLHYVSTENFTSPNEESNITNIEQHVVCQDEQPMYSFAFRFPNMQ